VEIESYLSKSTPFFQNYISRGLANIAIEMEDTKPSEPVNSPKKPLGLIFFFFFFSFHF